MGLLDGGETLDRARGERALVHDFDGPATLLGEAGAIGIRRGWVGPFDAFCVHHSSSVEVSATTWRAEAVELGRVAGEGLATPSALADDMLGGEFVNSDVGDMGRINTTAKVDPIVDTVGDVSQDGFAGDREPLPAFDFGFGWHGEELFPRLDVGTERDLLAVRDSDESCHGVLGLALAIFDQAVPLTW